jgi:hypothetical protein
MISLYPLARLYRPARPTARRPDTPDGPTRERRCDSDALLRAWLSRRRGRNAGRNAWRVLAGVGGEVRC